MCVCKEPLCCDPIPSPWNVVSVVYVCIVHLNCLKGQFHKVFGCFVSVSVKQFECNVDFSGIVVTGKAHMKKCTFCRIC
jgi:hypothetical protein